LDWVGERLAHQDPGSMWLCSLSSWWARFGCFLFNFVLVQNLNCFMFEISVIVLNCSLV